MAPGAGCAATDCIPFQTNVPAKAGSRRVQKKPPAFPQTAPGMGKIFGYARLERETQTDTDEAEVTVIALHPGVAAIREHAEVRVEAVFHAGTQMP